MGSLASLYPLARQFAVPFTWAFNWRSPRLIWRREKTAEPSKPVTIEITAPLKKADPLLIHFRQISAHMDLSTQKELSELELYAISRSYSPSQLQTLLANATLHERRALIYSSWHHLTQNNQPNLPILELLLQLSYAPTLAVREAAIKVLVQTYPKIILDRLAELINDPSEELDLRIFALTALDQFAEPEHYESIARVAKTGLPKGQIKTPFSPALPGLAKEIIDRRNSKS